MHSITCQEMRAIEEDAFSRGYSPDSLMEAAGLGIARAIQRYYPECRHATGFLGKGHNAGDALVVLRHLKNAGWGVSLRFSYPACELAPLTLSKLKLLGELGEESPPPAGSILLDGLLGIGAQGALRPPLAQLAAEMNTCRAMYGCRVVALDLPSGVDADSGEIHAGAVMADHTICVGLPKRGLLMSVAVNHVGALSLVSLDALRQLAEASRGHFQMICPASMRRWRRPYDTHKGQAGRVAIWAGSEGMLGAAALCAAAALRSGAGLVTVFTAPTLYPILAGLLPAEVMCQITIDPRGMLDETFDALVIGPGIGAPVGSISEKLFHVLQHCRRPCVVDADMLNLIAREGKQELFQNAQLILTPHPGEMQRIFPDLAVLSREESMRAFSSRFPSTLLLKGARSLIAQRDSDLFVNSTGTPAMATAGQGDVLAGIIAGLCGQGYGNLEGACMAAWLAGESAQLALAEQTEETLTARDVIRGLAAAFREIPATIQR